MRLGVFQVHSPLDVIARLLRSRGNPRALERLEAVRELRLPIEPFDPRAVADSLTYADVITALPPSSFARLASPIDYNDDWSRRNIDMLKSLVRGDKPQSIATMHPSLRERKYHGLAAVPYLDLRPESGGLRVYGHEGRHRMRALGELYDDAPQLMRVHPAAGSSRTSFKELLGDRVPWLSEHNPFIEVDPPLSLFARGGLV